MNRQRKNCIKNTSQCCAIDEASTAYTFRAPAWAAKNERIPEPAPTSRMILSLKSLILDRMARW